MDKDGGDGNTDEGESGLIASPVGEVEGRKGSLGLMWTVPYFSRNVVRMWRMTGEMVSGCSMFGDPEEVVLTRDPG